MATRDLTVYAQNDNERPLLSLLSTPETARRFELACGRKAGEVVINIINAAALNAQIYQCTPETVVTAALNAATLRLSLASNLGQACILPFKKNYKDAAGVWQNEYRAQLIVMVRGVKELAMRTNKYRVLNDFKLYEGQSVEEDQMTGRKTIAGNRTSDKVIGYGAYMCLTNGYEHTVYWPTEKIMTHAKRYSPTFDAKSGQFNNKSRWVTDFDQSASKTVIKDLIMNHGVISEDDRAALVEIDNELDGETISGDFEVLPEQAKIEAPATVKRTEAQNMEDLFGKDPAPAPVMVATAQALANHIEKTPLELAAECKTVKGTLLGPLTIEQLERVAADANQTQETREAATLLYHDKVSQMPTPEFFD